MLVYFDYLGGFYLRHLAMHNGGIATAGAGNLYLAVRLVNIANSSI